MGENFHKDLRYRGKHNFNDARRYLSRDDHSSAFFAVPRSTFDFVRVRARAKFSESLFVERSKGKYWTPREQRSKHGHTVVRRHGERGGGPRVLEIHENVEYFDAAGR